MSIGETTTNETRRNWPRLWRTAGALTLVVAGSVPFGSWILSRHGSRPSFQTGPPVTLGAHNSRTFDVLVDGQTTSYEEIIDIYSNGESEVNVHRSDLATLSGFSTGFSCGFGSIVAVMAGSKAPNTDPDVVNIDASAIEKACNEGNGKLHPSSMTALLDAFQLVTIEVIG